MCNTCDDNRFKLIEKYKAQLVEATNIADDPKEMDVIDRILFRFWQIGWLDKLEKPIRTARRLDGEKQRAHPTGGNGRTRNRVSDRRQIIRNKGEGTMMDDLISRQHAIDNMARVIWGYPNEIYPQLNDYSMALELAKDGLVKVIRCKDCKNWDTKRTLVFMCYCSELNRWTGDDYYCASGERKEEEK